MIVSKDGTPEGLQVSHGFFGLKPAVTTATNVPSIAIGTGGGFVYQRTIKVRIIQVRTRQVRLTQVRTMQVRTTQVCTRQVRITPHLIAHLRI